MRRVIACAVGLIGLALISEVTAQVPSPLLAIDQHRTTVVERIVTEWGDKLAVTVAGVNREQLREMLFAMRADQLLAASLAGSINGLRDVLASALTASEAAMPRMIATKALGDASDDVVYTPVTPCRLVETRPGTFAAVYQGGGAFAANEIRNYTVQGGNGVCLSQLPAGLNPSAVQLQVFGIPINSGASGDVEVLPQGSTFGSTATLVYLGTELITSASTTARINLANNQIAVQVRGGGANVAIDVVGYFKAPSGGFFAQGGNTFGTTAKLGTLDNQPLEIYVNNQRVMRFEPNAVSPNVVAGHSSNSVDASTFGQTIAGGGEAGICPGSRPCANQIFASRSFIGGGVSNRVTGAIATIGGGSGNTAGGQESTVGGGLSNNASGFCSVIAGGQANVASGLNCSAVGGGVSNTSSGDYSTVPGGDTNTASGYASFAAGNKASALHDHSFVWSDGTAWSSEGDGHFTAHARAVEFEGLESSRTAWVVFGKFAGQLITASSGANLTDAGVWVNATSSKAQKTEFAPVDPVDVLSKVAALPITTWRYKVGEGNVRHIGPMAEDFWEAFNVGYGDHTIADLDARGVALAAIQGLHQLGLEKDVRIASQDEKISALERTVADLKRAVEALVKP